LPAESEKGKKKTVLHIHRWLKKKERGGDGDIVEKKEKEKKEGLYVPKKGGKHRGLMAVLKKEKGRKGTASYYQQLRGMGISLPDTGREVSGCVETILTLQAEGKGIRGGM